MSDSSNSSSASETHPSILASDDSYANLRDLTVFPIFIDLPEPMIQVMNGKLYKPRKHWCFLVEIFSIDRFTRRLVLQATDKEHNLVVIAFYTEDWGRKLDTPELKTGHTLAIMYPIRHQFLDGGWGVRLEDYDSIKIFPTSLDNLLRLSDEVRSWPSSFGEHTECHGCGRKNVYLKTCSGCHLVKYCNIECQKLGWKYRNHKQKCMIVADTDFRKMMTTNWMVFRGFKKFLFRGH